MLKRPALKATATDKPVKILDKEVSQPLSVTVPFGTLPPNQYIRGARYRVDFARLLTRNYTKDVAELGQYDYDIRQVFKDNAIRVKALEDEEKRVASERERRSKAMVEVVTEVGDPQLHPVGGGEHLERV